LSQAEARIWYPQIMQLHQIAMQQMRGGFSNEIAKLREELLNFLPPLSNSNSTLQKKMWNLRNPIQRIAEQNRICPQATYRLCGRERD
jgi:hypothetical protein